VVKFLLLINVNIVFAQEEERPMRTEAPNARQTAQITRSSFNISQPAANSLLTEKALEQALTQHYIEQYSSARGIANLNVIMDRASIYMPFIREEVKKRGLPPELIYLPIIESGFQITARSRSGAMGLWQFMMNSIAPYDMKVTDLIDERRDFIKSTRGALQKLEDEYGRLGCWELTLAAYNSGLGAVTRTIQRTGRDCYWELSNRRELRAETINFVPRLIAVSYVMSKPRKYGINIWHERFEWVAIPLERQVSIDIIADEIGIDRALMRQLNAELLHGISPLGTGHLLKIPAEYHDLTVSVLERDDLPLIRYHYHVVRQGDTLWSMSRNYGASLSMIEQHNPGISDRYLRIGETVVTPAYPGVSAPSSSTPAVNQANSGTHVVQRGETFWSIGRRYGIDPQAIAEANGMKLDDILHAGRTLRLPIR